MTSSVNRGAVLVVVLALSLAACGTDGEEETAAPVAETATEGQPSEEPSPAPTPDPEAPENAVFADGDDMAHTMCELWTTTLDDAGDLRDVAEDAAWYGEQVDNEFMQSPVNSLDWGEENPVQTTILCRWNGYEKQEGSPADLLG